MMIGTSILMMISPTVSTASSSALLFDDLYLSLIIVTGIMYVPYIRTENGDSDGGKATKAKKGKKPAAKPRSSVKKGGRGGGGKGKGEGSATKKPKSASKKGK